MFAVPAIRSSTSDSAPAEVPFALQREGPFGQLDLLAIGVVLLPVLVILGLRRLARRRSSSHH